MITTRHADTFLTLDKTAADHRFKMPFLKTYNYEGAYIDAQHGRLIENLHDTGMIDLGINGWLLPADALKLYEMVFFCGGDMLELGCYHGLSTSIANAASNAAGLKNVIVSIDLDEIAIRAASTNLATHPGAQRVHFFCTDAGKAIRDLAAAKRTFHFAFIDHSHAYDPVYEACKSLHRVTEVGAFCLFHDFNDPRNSAPDQPNYAVYQGVMDGLDPRRFEFWGIYGCSGLFRRIGPL